MAQTLSEELKELAEKHGVSREHIISSAHDAETRGTGARFIKKVLAGERRPNMAMLRAMAAVVDEPPEVFTHYRLLAAQDLFDVDVQGLDRAVDNLKRLEAVLGGSTSRGGGEEPPSTAAVRAAPRPPMPPGEGARRGRRGA